MAQQLESYGIGEANLHAQVVPTVEGAVDRIAKLVGDRTMVVEWTLRPQDTSEATEVPCGCGCGCSCIA